MVYVHTLIFVCIFQRPRSKMKDKKDKKGGGDKGKSSSVKEMNPWPEYIQVRWRE